MSESDRKGRTKRVRERVGSSASAAIVRRPSHRHSCSGLRGFERTRSMEKGCAHDGKGGRVVGLGCGPLARAWTHDDGKPRLLDDKNGRPARRPARPLATDMACARRLNRRVEAFQSRDAAGCTTPCYRISGPRPNRREIASRLRVVTR